MSNLSITQKLAAVTQDAVGKVFTSKELVALVVDAFPGTNPASVTVSDRAASGKQSTQYSDYLFERVSGGYKVLPVAERIARPSQSRARGVTLDAALASAKAKLQPSATEQADETQESEQ